MKDFSALFVEDITLWHINGH